MTARPFFYVLSGGPCSGKSSLIAALSARGCPTVREASTDLIESPQRVSVPGSASGSVLYRDLRRLDPLSYQRAVFHLQLEREREMLEALGTSPAGPIFVDRGIGDHFGYLRLAGLAPFPELVAAWPEALARYGAILFCELSPNYSAAEHRDEDLETAQRIDELLHCEYRARHPRVISIPWLPVPQRTDLVLALVARCAAESETAVGEAAISIGESHRTGASEEASRARTLAPTHRHFEE